MSNIILYNKVLDMVGTNTATIGLDETMREFMRRVGMDTLTTLENMPIPIQSKSNLLYFAQSGGTRIPNKNGTLGTTYSKYAQYATYNPLAWEVPAGGTIVIGYPYFMAVEGNANVNEQLCDEAMFEVVTLSYLDAQGIKNTVIGTLSNDGLLSSSTDNGGVLVTFKLTTALPKGAVPTVGIAMTVPYGNRIAAGGILGAGSVSRKSESTSFASVVTNGASLSTVSGSASGNFSGYYVHPVFFAAHGADGRAVFFLDGDSIGYGKGTPGEVAVNRVAGILETALNRATNGYQIPCFNSNIAGSGFSRTDPTDGNYIPSIREHTRKLVDQLIAFNDNQITWTHYLCQHGTNSIQASAASQIRLIKTRHVWLKEWHNALMIQTTMIQKVTSADGFRTLAGQTLSGADALPSGTFAPPRWGFNDSLLNSLLDGTVDYAVNTYGGIAYDLGAYRDHVAIAPYTANLTRATTSGAATVFLDAAPELGAALCLDPLSGSGQSRIAIAVVKTLENDYQVLTDPGASSGVYPAKPIGTLVGEHYMSDGQSNLIGLHVSAPANKKIAEWQGFNSFDQLKADLARDMEYTVIAA